MQQIRPLLRDAERNVPAARMSHQINWPKFDVLDEPDHVGDVLCDRVAATAAIPLLWKEVAQTECYYAMPPGQRTEHARPHAEITEGTVHTNKRSARPNIEIGHVRVVDPNVFHSFPYQPL